MIISREVIQPDPPPLACSNPPPAPPPMHKTRSFVISGGAMKVPFSVNIRYGSKSERIYWIFRAEQNCYYSLFGPIYALLTIYYHNN